MDYDENDFQSQNFHLVGEDKFSANLRSFALPKFDLDEHLRFDSLVEEEVLLGIQGQENNWIDFPPGNSAIEFSSSAVESCSIGRHRNVWSEATSTESVDLLLKSVGDDEMIKNKAVIMETGANDESHGIDSRVDLYLEKDDDHKPYVMNILPVDPKFVQDKIPENLSGSNGGQGEMLANLHGLSQSAEGEDSRMVMYVDNSLGKFSSDGERGHNLTTFYSTIESSKAVDDDLCETVLDKKVDCVVLKRKETPSVDDSDSSVLDSPSLESNQDVKPVMKNEKLSTEVFSGGQHQNRTSSFSVFHEKSNGLMMDIPYQTKYLNVNSEMCESFFAPEECIGRVALPQEQKVENNSFTSRSQSILKITPITEGYRSAGEKVPFDSIEGDNDLQGVRSQLINNSVISSNTRMGKIGSCMDAIDDKQDPVGKLVEKSSSDVENGTQVLKESPTSIHVHYKTQGTKIEDCGRLSTSSLSFTCDNSGLGVEGNHDKDMDVDRQEMKLDQDKDLPGESSFPVDLTDVSSLPVVIDSESMTSSSTYCKSSLSTAPISVDLTEVLMSEVHVSVDKDSSPTYMDPGRIMSGSKTIKKVQGSPPAIQETVDASSLDVSANKLVEEELGAVLSSSVFEKATFVHLSTPEHATIDLAVGKKEPLMQVLPESDIIEDDRKVLGISYATASSLSTVRLVSEKESALASVSYPLNIKDTSPKNVLQCNSGTQLSVPLKSPDSQLPHGTVGLNLPIEEKESSSCPIPDLVLCEGNELKLSDASMLANSNEKGDKETGNGEAASCDCAEAVIVTEHLSNTVMQPPSPVRSVEFTLPQNDTSSSAGNSVGNGKTLRLERNGICHGPREVKDDILNSSEVVSTVWNEASVALVADNLNSHIKCSSQMCPATAAESNSSEAQSSNSNSSERNCSSPIIINFRGSHPDNLDHQEPETSDNIAPVPSGKDETAGNVDGSSNGLHGPSVEDRSSIFSVSASKDLIESGNCSELSVPNLKMPKDNSQGLPVDLKGLDSSSETHIQGKPKNSSRSSNEKKMVSKGKIKKEARALKQSPELDVKCSISTCKSAGNLSKDKTLVEMQEKSSPIGCSAMKTSPYLDTQTSSIPDLNSSSSLTLSHHQFTDLQQVQLRAQIFVYGALISGMPPDEAYMVSAFGGTDGGRNQWHVVWHASIERFQTQKSPLGYYDTPSHSRPAIWIPEHVSMGNDVQSKASLTCATKSGNGNISSSVLSSTVSLPSPLWSLSYGNDGHHANTSRGTYMNFCQTPSPLPHQSFVSRQHVGANSPWLSQSSRSVPWFFSSQISALDGIPQYSTAPVTETAHITPVRDSCGPHMPNIEVTPHRVLMNAPDTVATTTTAALQIETTKGAASSLNDKYTPTTQKVRKRKKNTTPEELSLPSSQNLPVYFPTPSNFRSHPLPSTSMLSSPNPQLNIFSHVPVSVSAPHVISPSKNPQISILYEDTCSKLEQAKLQAEDAASLAASTVKYSLGIWSQLAAHKNSGIVLQIEEKLASSAATAAAAASVAKAAAAAARVASSVALQAKIMADEAISSTRTVNTVFNPDSDSPDVGKRLVGIPPVSILKGMDKVHGSGAVISAASEAARRRVESASAATKRAENLDAIVKAAELAAEAVTQAGKIVAMGDPLPFTLRELVDVGPEEFWRGHDCISMKLSETRDMHEGERVGLGSVEVQGESAKQLDEHYSNDNETRNASGEGELSSLNECDQKLQRSGQGNSAVVGTETDNSNPSCIQKGSLVEVMSDGDGLKGAWLSARVLDLDDKKAYVCYSDISTTEGKLKEWIVLNNGEKAPRIRTARSITSVKHEGTRKRHREHLGSSYIWEVGDHVDAWVHDRWWEGTITDKNRGDEVKLTVHFSASGEKHVVDAWNLRPSLIWKEGQWVEWSHAKGKSSKPHEGDTPREKRQRLCRPEEQINSEVDGNGMGKLSGNILIDEPRKPDDSRTLVLSAKDRTFTIGKNSNDLGTSDALKQKRTGLQKVGSRVVFGVPRPGKKRKFMEVSKHYVANKSDKITEGNDSIKFAKYLMPQASRQSRSTTKVDIKGKKAVQSKPRGSVKTVNSQGLQIRSVDDKEKGSLSVSNDDAVHVYHKDAISSFKGNTNSFDKMNAFKFSSFQNQAEKKKVPAVEMEHSMQPTVATLSKKKCTPSSQTDLALKQTSTDRSLAAEDKGHGNPGKPLHEVEPRRSNRRIQPTSRLLEGLQSSLVISKFPVASHDRKPPRGGASSKGNAHV